MALPLALAACGFAPAFGPSGAASALLGQVNVENTTTRMGFEFIKKMEERLGRGAGGRYDLTYDISTEKVSLGLTADGSITRYNLLGSITWQLKDSASGAKLASGTEQNFTAWSATGVTIAAVNAETDAETRLMHILADQIATRLIALSPKLLDAG
ncbi:MAG: LPS assembly lipoprotein LptE [Cypionkella sp.]|nr:LPS assembly lipoprotein LptE [Cypionkella sp.]